MDQPTDSDDMMKIHIPLGAVLAAEHAYANLTPSQRQEANLVAELLLQSAAPFMGSVSRQLGRGRISQEASRDLFREILRGGSSALLADLHGVSEQTIRIHYRRRLVVALTRHRGGASIAGLAREFGCSTAVLANEFEKEITRGQVRDSTAGATGLPVRVDDHAGAVDRGHRRSDSGRRRPRSGGRPGRGGQPSGLHGSAAA